VPDSSRQVKRRGAVSAAAGVVCGMHILSALPLLADTLLVRPVAVPAPWYSVASGILSIVVTLLLLGIAVALLGMARALKSAEDRLGTKMQGLSTELIPLARNLNAIATQLASVTTDAKADFARLSATIGVVDDAVRDVIDATEARLARVATLLDAVQDEAEATVADATGLMRGVRAGARTLLRPREAGDTAPRRRARGAAAGASAWDAARTEAEVRARLAELEASLLEAVDVDDDDELPADDTGAEERVPRDTGGPRVRRGRR
jgi:hypothetical protein